MKLPLQGVYANFLYATEWYNQKNTWFLPKKVFSIHLIVY